MENGTDGGAAGSAATLLCFTQDHIGEASRVLVDGGAGAVHALSASDALSALRRDRSGLQQAEQLGVVGSPPSDGIGYGLAPLVAAMTGPRRVTLVDASAKRARRMSGMRFIAEAAPTTISQVAGAGVAVAAQLALAKRLIANPPTPAPPHRAEPSEVLYIRPLVGIPTTVGGSITHSHGVIGAMRQAGLAVDPLTTDPGIAATAAAEVPAPCEWRVVRIPRATRAMPASLAMGGDLALASGSRGAATSADFIYQRHARFSLAGALIARLSGRPLFLEYNGSEAVFEASYDATPLAGQLALCEDAALAAATRIIVMSDVDRENLARRGIAEDRILTNPNGVDAERFAAGGGSALRQRLGVGSDEVLVGFVGSFGPWHGSPLLADAFARLRERHPNVRLLLVGDGPDRGEVERRLEAAGPAVRDGALLVGKVAPGEVPAHLDACDVLVSPHVPMPNGVEFFGSPTKLFEYMAAGKGIVASRLGQIGDVLEHERTALLTTPGDAAELVASMERLIADAPLLERLGAAARREALENHTWGANVERVLRSYREWARRTG
jgi:glycosyltransferase involved in cell wall biosynthesis